MNWEMVGGLVRHVLTFGGGFLVTDGTLTDGDLQAVIAGVIAISGVIWSVFHKNGVAARIKSALEG